MAGDLLDRLKEKAVPEAKKLLWIVAYLWVLLGLFALHKSIILGEFSFYHQGFAIINAFVLGKIIFVADELHLAGKPTDKPLIYPVAFRSAVFALILIVFHLLEELLAGLWRGKTVADSIGANGFFELLVLAVIVFVALMPFFALKEVARDLGGDKLFEQFFLRRTRTAPLQ